MHRSSRGEPFLTSEQGSIQLTSQLYHRSINAEETLSGLPSSRPRNLDADQVLQTDAHARAEYIQRESENVVNKQSRVADLARSTRAAIPMCRDDQGFGQVDRSAALHCQDDGTGDPLGLTCKC